MRRSPIIGGNEPTHDANARFRFELNFFYTLVLSKVGRKSAALQGASFVRQSQ
jgi:hypothetical protein